MENHIISTGKNVIDLQIKALKKLKNSLDSNFEKAIKKIIKCKSKVIIPEPINCEQELNNFNDLIYVKK